MPLSNGYGVVIGQFDHHRRDPINTYRQYHHQNVYVTTAARINWHDVPTSAPFTNGRGVHNIHQIQADTAGRSNTDSDRHPVP